MNEQLMTAIPQWEFHVEGTGINGFVTAQTHEEAIDILKKIHLGTMKVLKVEDNISLIQPGKFELQKESIKDKIIQISHVNGE